jgi:two-component system chemotaxis sensor kinase CheA
MTIPTQSANLFQEELREVLAELDTAILDLDNEQAEPEAVNRIFRGLHTIKGACDMFGMHGAVALLHDIESLWDRVRRSIFPASKALIDLTFAVKDQLVPMVESGLDVAPDEKLLAVMSALAESPVSGSRDIPRKVRVDGSVSAPLNFVQAVLEDRPDRQASPGHQRTYRIRFTPSDKGHLRKADPESFLDALRALGQAELSADVSAVPPLQDLDPADCHLRWEIRLATDQDPDAVRDVFLFLDNPGDVAVEEISANTTRLAQAGAPGLDLAGRGDQLVLTDRTDQADSKDWAQATSGGSGQTSGHAAGKTTGLPAGQKSSGTDGPAATAADSCLSTAGRPKVKEPAQSLRVEAAKLDNLVNLVGELVIAQARLTQIASDLARSDLTGVAEEIERLSAELRDNTLGIRMLPIGTTFSRFRRLVRDLSSELDKKIELVAEGGETELDKTVIEQLVDPLVHLLRNSIDHGLETPAERAASGKPEHGTIRLFAKQAGGAVIIRIVDDGRGLDTARIQAKAAERGLVAPDARLADQEIHQLIFAPGFSTAEKVTSISGRGVGMDVVKRSIEALRGQIEIDSEIGRGTSITISLPLTLAIIEGLQVRAGGEFYIIPLAMVEECVELVHDDHRQGARNRTLSLRGEIVPFIRLRETFLLEGDTPRLEQVVVTRHENGRTGIAVDEVVGQQQTVIKNLGRLIGRVEGISGATINGDGSMALILDVPQLVGSVQRQCVEAWKQ